MTQLAMYEFCATLFRPTSKPWQSCGCKNYGCKNYGKAIFAKSQLPVTEKASQSLHS